MIIGLLTSFTGLPVLKVICMIKANDNMSHRRQLAMAQLLLVEL